MEFKGGKFTRIVLFLLAKFVRTLGFLVKKEYGRKYYEGGGVEWNTFASGYYLVAKKLFD